MQEAFSGCDEGDTQVREIHDVDETLFPTVHEPWKESLLGKTIVYCFALRARRAASARDSSGAFTGMLGVAWPSAPWLSTMVTPCRFGESGSGGGAKVGEATACVWETVLARVATGSGCEGVAG